jgi:hypothetical protein
MSSKNETISFFIICANRSEVFVPAAGLWGKKQANNTWDGVIGMVTKSEVDVGVCDVAMNAERVGVVSYTMQIATFQYVIKHSA